MTVQSKLISSEMNTVGNVEFTRKWPDFMLDKIDSLDQPSRFPYLLQLVAALSNFVVSSNEGIVVASVVENHWIETVWVDTVSVMISTVLYRWNPDMSFEDWQSHMFDIQSQ